MNRKSAQLSRREALLGLGALALTSACGAGTDAAPTETDTGTAGPDTTGGPSPDVAVEPDVPAIVASRIEDSPEIPAITPNRHHYVTSCCGSPVVDIATWSIAVLDRGKPLGTITLDLLEQLGAVDKEHTLECIGTGPSSQKISNAIWSGRPLTEVLAALGITVPAGTVALKMTGADSYHTAIPIADLDRPSWLVWRMDGVALSAEHGYPARLLVPGRYGTKNPKWITGFEFLDQPYVGYWEAVGWSDTAVYRPNTFIRYPAGQAILGAGTVRVTGTAYAGSDPVVSVDVRIDEGPWQPATLDYSPGADIWSLWHFDWETGSAQAPRQIQARCKTASGGGSLEIAEPKFDGGGYGGSMAITVTIV